MGFIEAYKRLEKLCGEILNDDRRISAYIDEMANAPRGAYLVSGWEDDLKKLKHYRWVRNQIVHNPDCNEENMCCYDDAQWLNNFHARIMNQTDPLALYRKALQPRYAPVVKKTDSGHNQDRDCNKHQTTENTLSCGTALLITLAIVVVIVIWLLLKA